MELITRKRFMLFTGSANPELAEAVADELGVRLGRVEMSQFANGEVYTRPLESVRGVDCFVIQSHAPEINFHIMEQLILIDSLKRASAHRITAVVPFFGYARADKKVLPREPISARLMSDLFVAAGADRIVSVDLHTGQIQGFFPKPFDHLTALPIVTDYLKEQLEGPTTVVSPDAGGVKRAEKYARYLGAYVAFVHKRRELDVHNESQALTVVGAVRNRNAVIVDDMIDTGGTVANAARLLRDSGANQVLVAATHPVLSAPALDRLKQAPIDEVVVTDTLPISRAARDYEKLTRLSVAPVLAEALQAIFMDSSVSAIFLGDNN
ncbi:MAG: ribose-phosphate diphosphokinase [Acidimicrobiia bacterium]|nr:ribose-phosphate diphosphokinase [bacterium]MXX64269.1 ribose-phosphate diphosphokinase [Acidimicrobiia bacterium]MCY3580423.1 ribose-phosphate diphosphokinase [bacterium]MCY3651935.1 ribose-phosphate diphosphokinase [bacterium]MDE0644255.1 ribose-phosphate diphosphokinase [bacterium]